MGSLAKPIVKEDFFLSQIKSNFENLRGMEKRVKGASHQKKIRHVYSYFQRNIYQGHKIYMFT